MPLNTKTRYHLELEPAAGNWLVPPEARLRTANGFPLAWPDPWHTITMNTPTKHAETVELQTSCPRCYRNMTLLLPPDTEPADMQRLAQLVLCDQCMEHRGVHPPLVENLPLC